MKSLDNFKSVELENSDAVLGGVGNSLDFLSNDHDQGPSHDHDQGPSHDHDQGPSHDHDQGDSNNHDT